MRVTRGTVSFVVSANQFSARLCIASICMLMRRDFRKWTPQLTVFVVALGVMRMNDKIRIAAVHFSVRTIAIRSVLMNIQRLRRADGNHFLHRRYLRVASVCVYMLRDWACSFHRNSRQNQCTDSAERHDRTQTHQHLMPALMKAVIPYVFLTLWQIIHAHLPPPPILPFRNKSKATPGIRFYQQAVLRQCSRFLNDGNLLTWNGGLPCKNTGYPAPDTESQHWHRQKTFQLGTVHPKAFRPRKRFRTRQYRPIAPDRRLPVSPIFYCLYKKQPNRLAQSSILSVKLQCLPR